MVDVQVKKCKWKVSGNGRYVGGKTLGNLGFCTSWAVDVEGTGREWIEVVEVDLPLKDLPEAFYGKRVVQLSDLHCSRTVSTKYLARCIKRVNQLAPDMCVLTGDYITYDTLGRFSRKVVGLIERINAPLGIYAVLGNHDYGIGGTVRLRRDDSLGRMVEDMELAGVELLQNDSRRVKLSGQSIRIVGLGDLWAREFRPSRAFAGVDEDEIVIGLSHNPNGVDFLSGYKVDALMCGHTHGIRRALSGPREKGLMSSRFYYDGLYEVDGSKLYVNRGLGRVGKSLFNKRPEITVFRLC